MISLSDYHRATNAAYQTLLTFGVSKLPVAVMPVIQRIPALRVVSYSELCDRRGISLSAFLELNVSLHGFIILKKNKAIIFYNDTVNPETIRFTLAHELGHYVLHHTDENSVTNREANCFARNFLCPVPVTESFALDNALDCCEIFDITPPAADVVLDKKSTDHANADPYLYSQIAWRFGLDTLTKETQIQKCPARLLRAVADFSSSPEQYSPAI